MRPLLCAAAALVTVSPASAQTMRNWSATRPVGTEKVLTATLEYGAGAVAVTSAKPGYLYSARIRYDADRFMPLQQFDVNTGTLRLGIENAGGMGIKVTSRAQLAQTALIELSPDVPLALTANLGASEASLDLGGMTLRSLAVHSGASRTTVAFDTPTQGACTTATFSVGATELQVAGLANAGCRSIRVEGGVGAARLDFSGTWRTNSDLVVELAMGKLTLVIPKGTGVRINGDRFISPMEASGFTREGNSWVTPDLLTARRVLQVQLKTAMAGIEVRWQ